MTPGSHVISTPVEAEQHVNNLTCNARWNVPNSIEFSSSTNLEKSPEEKKIKKGRPVKKIERGLVKPSVYHI